MDLDGTANMANWQSPANGKHRNHVSAINAANATILDGSKDGWMEWEGDWEWEWDGPLQYFFIVLIIGCNVAN